MKELFFKTFRLINRYLYTLLGASLSTRIALSGFGKSVFKMLDDSNKELKIYNTSEGVKVKLTRNEAIMLGIFHFGVINLYETNVLIKLIKQGYVLIDVGAYVDGWYTLLTAKLSGKSGHVYSFEPNPNCLKRLKENIKLNNLVNVTLEKMALAEKEGYRIFYLSENTSSFYKNHYKERKQSRIRVITTTLDDYVKKRDIKKIDLIKVDVECAEMEVLKGAQKILRPPNAPDLIVEVIDSQLKVGGSSKKELLVYLKKFDYKTYTFGPNGLVKYLQGKENPKTLNFFFTKRDKIFENG